MKLSIITINFNNLTGLSRTIQSVFEQVFQDFEYIIIDGGSSDGSKDLLEKYKGRFSYLISEKDNGVFDAMNKGIFKAKGDYLLFLNSGDFLIDKNVLSNVFSENLKSEIICGRCRISNNNEVLGLYIPPEKHTLIAYFGRTIAHQATFIKRVLFDKYGVYNDKLKIKSDWEFWIKTIILGNATVENVDVVISDYNLEGLSSSVDNNKKSNEEIEKVLSELPPRIIEDYKDWDQLYFDLNLYKWINDRKLLKKLLYKYRKIVNKCRFRNEQNTHII